MTVNNVLKNHWKIIKLARVCFFHRLLYGDARQTTWKSNFFRSGKLVERFLQRKRVHEGPMEVGVILIQRKIASGISCESRLSCRDVLERKWIGGGKIRKGKRWYRQTVSISPAKTSRLSQGSIKLRNQWESTFSRNYRCRLLHRSGNFTVTANFPVIFVHVTAGLILINLKLRRPARFETFVGTQLLWEIPWKCA